MSTRAAWRETTVRTLLLCYRRLVSPAIHTATHVGGGCACRFQPTCSEYAAIAVAEHGWLRGGTMVAWRLLRCHPLCSGGFDPVPARRGAVVSAVRAGHIT